MDLGKMVLLIEQTQLTIRCWFIHTMVQMQNFMKAEMKLHKILGVNKMILEFQVQFLAKSRTRW